MKMIFLQGRLLYPSHLFTRLHAGVNTVRNGVKMSVGSIRRCMFVGDVDGFAMGMWMVELCGVRDGHSYVVGFGDLALRC